MLSEIYILNKIWRCNLWSIQNIHSVILRLFLVGRSEYVSVDLYNVLLHLSWHETHSRLLELESTTSAWWLCHFIVKMQNICNLIDWNSVHISGMFNYYRANINGMWKARKLDGIYKKFESTLTDPYICRYRVNQHLIVLNLDSVSINKILATEFLTIRVSQNLNLM